MQTALPNTIIDELFNIEYKVSDIVMEHLLEDLAALQFVSVKIDDYDHSIHILGNMKSYLILIIVDRIQREFQVDVTSSLGTFLPYRGQWQNIMAYLEGLSAHM